MIVISITSTFLMRLGQRPPVQVHFILHHDTQDKQSLPLAPREVLGAASV